MSDIFISYAKKDRDKAQQLAQVLEDEGWTVWWDPHIPAGKTFDEVIEEALEAAGCVIVLWTHNSVNSEWVRNEANEGHKRGILLPILMDEVMPPLAFRRVQAADLIGWDGSRSSEKFQKLVEDVADVIGPPPGGIPKKPKKEEKSPFWTKTRLFMAGLALGVFAVVALFLVQQMPQPVDPTDLKKPLPAAEKIEVDAGDEKERQKVEAAAKFQAEEEQRRKAAAEEVRRAREEEGRTNGARARVPETLRNKLDEAAALLLEGNRLVQGEEEIVRQMFTTTDRQLEYRLRSQHEETLRKIEDIAMTRLNVLGEAVGLLDGYRPADRSDWQVMLHETRRLVQYLRMDRDAILGDADAPEELIAERGIDRLLERAVDYLRFLYSEEQKFTR